MTDTPWWLWLLFGVSMLYVIWPAFTEKLQNLLNWPCSWLRHPAWFRESLIMQDGRSLDMFACACGKLSASDRDGWRGTE